MDQNNSRSQNERKYEQRETEDENSERRNICQVTTPLERNLIFIIAILVAIGIVLTVALAYIKKENYRNSMEFEAIGNKETQMKAGINESQICYTSSCITEASNLLKSMDLTKDPCRDFYSFVCGNWIKNAYLSSSSESQFTKMRRTIILRVKEILDDLKKEVNLPDHKRKVSDFYQGCMDKDRRELLGARELLSDLEKFGGWPLIKEDWRPSEFIWSNLMVDLFKNGYTNDMLFSIEVGVDGMNTSRSLITISNPTLGEIAYDHQLVEKMSSYKEVIFKLAKLLKRDIDEEKSMEAIKDAFEIEYYLYRISFGVDWTHLDSFYNIMTLRELGKFAAMIPWRKLLKDLLPYGTEISDDERIMVTSPFMLEALNEFLEQLNSSKDGKKALANYMFYRTVFDASRHLSKNFYVSVNNFLDEEKCVLWESCVKMTMDSFPSSLAASYVTKYMDTTTKHLLEGMLDDLKSALLEDIRKSKWLDEVTKQYALLKVRKMQSAIAYRDEIMDDETLNNFYKDINITDDHFSDVKQVSKFNLKKNMEGLHDVRERFRWSTVKYLLKANAYNFLTQNTILIPVGLLQDTIFDPGRPNYITYGSLGMIIGHELNHAFDSTGWLYDAEGNYRIWWSLYSLMKFQERTKCFEDQYREYYTPVAGTFVNGYLTLDENLADNGGLQTAYNAYMKVLERTGPEKSLPGLPYSARQMFWISFASVWCERETDESIKESMEYSEHPISQFRVTGALSNIEEFSQDFNCKWHSPMYSRSKCSLWK